MRLSQPPTSFISTNTEAILDCVPKTNNFNNIEYQSQGQYLVMAMMAGNKTTTFLRAPSDICKNNHQGFM